MEVDHLAEPMYATRKDVHLNIRTCLEFKREGQDGV